MNNTSEKLIQISMRTFSEMGYYGTSLNNIAKELGIKKASLYNYFNSKDELYEQCIERCMNKGMELIETISTQPQNAHEDLLNIFKNYIYNSNYIVDFYTQLSFAPSNFKNIISDYNKEVSNNFNNKLVDIYNNSQFEISKDEFILFINMFVYGWIYRRSFVQNDDSPEKIMKEFNHHFKTLLRQTSTNTI